MLNRDVKQFGKKFMFDGEEDTCWNSDQVCVYGADEDLQFSRANIEYSSTSLASSGAHNGLIPRQKSRSIEAAIIEPVNHSLQGNPQHVMVELPSPSIAQRLELKFQGGFVGKECVLLAGDSEGSLVELQRFYPEDINSIQVSFRCGSVYMIVGIKLRKESWNSLFIGTANFISV